MNDEISNRINSNNSSSSSTNTTTNNNNSMQQEQADMNLWKACREWALFQGATPATPPPVHNHNFVTFKHAALQSKQTETAGWGYVAATDLAAGTRLLMERPLAMVMEWEGEEDNDDDENKDDDNNGQQQQQQQPEQKRSQNPPSMATVMEEDDNDDDDNLKHMMDESSGLFSAGPVLHDDDEQDEEEQEEYMDKHNELLYLDILEALLTNPALWTDHLVHLFPRNAAELRNLPAGPAPDDETFLQLEALLQQLKTTTVFDDDDDDNTVQEIAQRLPHIIRYNALSVETGPELLSHPQTLASLSGVALYEAGSLFNHNSRPNVCRWAVGDVTVWVTNQIVPAGTDLCISYLAHDVLCETRDRRAALLQRDFVENNDNHHHHHDDDNNNNNNNHHETPPHTDDAPEFPVVDTDLQNELMTLNPLERLTQLEELMQQATAANWFGCDVQNLRILQALTLDKLGQFPQALQQWHECIRSTERYCPVDESLVMLHSQAALTAFRIEPDRAVQHAAQAVRIHSILFGGTVRWFRLRYETDLALPLRPPYAGGNDDDDDDPVETLWPMNG